MSRPFVVCHMLCSLDGRIDGSWFRLPETASALRATGQIRRDYGCDAVINGAVTCAEIYAEGYVDRLPTAGRSFERTDHLPPTQAKHTVVCMDTEGSLAWSSPTVTRRGEVSRVIDRQSAGHASRRSPPRPPVAAVIDRHMPARSGEHCSPHAPRPGAN